VNENLTGVWSGQYSYLGGQEPTSFTATLMDIAGSLSGSTHEAMRGRPLTATLEGLRDGRSVRFSKLYDPGQGLFDRISYRGALSLDFTEIEGLWIIRNGWWGEFLMVRNERRAEAVREAQSVEA
jgi:hypothetical protein